MIIVVKPLQGRFRNFCNGIHGGLLSWLCVGVVTVVTLPDGAGVTVDHE